MNKAREIIEYCYQHGRIINVERHKIAVADLDAQAEQIAIKDKQIESLELVVKGDGEQIAKLIVEITDLKAELGRMSDFELGES